MLESISSTHKKKNIVEAQFGIPGASTEPENYLRLKLTVESNIGSMLEFNRYLSDITSP